MRSHPSAPLPEVGPPVARGARVPLGRTEIGVLPFGLGTGGFDRLAEPRAGTVLLDRYAQTGGNLVHVSDRDTAAAELVGDWIRSRGVRDDIVISARIGAPRMTREGAVRLADGVERMLSRLDVDHLDVLVLDASGQESGGGHLEAALADAERLVAGGVVRAVGAHGIDAAQMLEARVFASTGYPRLDVLEVPFGLGDRGVYEGEMQRLALPQEIAVMPIHAVPRGLLAPPQSPGRQGRAARLFHWRGKLARALDSVSHEAGLTPAATAFAWARAQPGVVAPIVNVFAAHQIDDLAPAATADLTRAQTARLDRAASR
ncbi:aldo/keto reductase [Microbacterium suaedae]|uniref:aldo/keto reductase n=1 Tax=Microbacterium suaedae TaxID=2067813 RepID=UPI0013A62039|nr:aldo/keto reductase [Microbacterium suaedae]